MLTRSKEIESASHRSRGVRAVTLVEVVVTVSIGVLVIGGIMSVFMMSVRSWKEGSGDVSVQSGARLIVEKMVRGRGGRFGLREAAEEDVTVDEDGKGITFLVDKNTPPTFSKEDDTQVRIYFQDGSILYDPSSEQYGDEVPIVGFGTVEDVQFQVDGRSVGITLRMRETHSVTRPSQVKFQTKVFLRKSSNPDTET